MLGSSVVLIAGFLLLCAAASAHIDAFTLQSVGARRTTGWSRTHRRRELYWWPGC